jgi:DNA-binding cell septation regulator SpoVG
MPTHEPSDDARSSRRPRAASEEERRRGGWAGDRSTRDREGKEIPATSSRAAHVEVSRVKFFPALPEDRANGVLCYASCQVDHKFRIAGLKVRLTEDHTRLVLAFPGLTDGRGRFHQLLWPCNDDVRREIERQVFAEFKARASEIQELDRAATEKRG